MGQRNKDVSVEELRELIASNEDEFIIRIEFEEGAMEDGRKADI